MNACQASVDPWPGPANQVSAIGMLVGYSERPSLRERAIFHGSCIALGVGRRKLRKRGLVVSRIDRVCSDLVRLTVLAILVITAGAAGCGSGDSGGCTNTPPDAGANSCSFSLPLPCKPCIACAPLPPGDTGGCGPPDISIFSWHGGGGDTSLRYPVGCTVYLPTENPYYPGGPQSCDCATEPPDAGPFWECPI